MKNTGNMKLTRSLLILAAALAAVSCQQKAETPSEGEFVDISLTAGIPGAIGTYADGDASSSDAFSHQGGALNVDHEQLDLRYIIEVWTNEQTPRLAFRDVQTIDKDFHKTPVTFNMRLQSLSYYFVLWADFVTEDTSEDLHYSTDANLQNITYSEDIAGPGDMASDEMDAYCAVEQVDFITEGMTKSITLQRPFGKIRLLATDRISDGAVQSEYPARVSVDFGNATVPASFNALTGLPLEQTITIGQFTAESTKENALVNGDEYPDSYLLGYYYIFAADQSTSYSMDVTCYDQNNNGIGTRNLSSIPLQKNKLTTVIGNFYTSEGSLEIIVEDPFENPENISTNEKQLLVEAANNGGEITLQEDCIFSEPFIVNPGPGKTTEINLNGHTIESINPQNDAILVQSGTLIINGDGKVGGENGYYAVWATGDSKVILNGGNYFGNGSCIQAKDNAQVEINGGYYKVGQPFNGVYFVINLQDNQPNTIVVKGGQFENCDPAKTGTEPDGVSDNFVADGYSSVKISDNPAVYEVKADATE